ncbi:MAG: UDP-N-acetylmuramoyl-L-alanine--D-glutamate ligase [Rubrivivax sp.]|nr:UDP-N-acetylmuramoyl-L-alanine--D-glutamate ligase [Rubrivivax sp.]
MDWLQNTPVLVLGLGTSGLAMARWCARHGAAVTVWDSREQPPGAEALAAEHPDVARVHGALEPALLQGCQLVLKSPGLAPADERIAPLLAEARATGIAVLGELDLFARALADLKATRGYAPQLLAITGTNGKTTTTAMTALLVERAGRRVAMAGNIGPALLDVLAAELSAVESDAESDAETDAESEAKKRLPEVWVLELSSFQLEGGGTGVRGFEPDAAAVLNLTQDHLDWHGSMPAYGAAKARIFGTQATCVINRSDAAVEALLPRPELHEKGPQKGKPKGPERKALRFGLDAPRAPGDFGIVVESGMAWLVRALPQEEGIRLKKGEEPEIHLQRLMPADALRVRGRHNAANALAALALATAIGCPLAPMLHGLREYTGEPHRVQFVAKVGEVDAYDDSKGTNVGATVAALEGLGADLAPGRLVVILGGDGKGQDFAPLAAPLARHARAVATIGRDAAAIEAVIEQHAELRGKGLPLQRFVSLELAVNWCFAQAQPGDAVLLSPACASLDMFRNYAHRAEVFVAAVQALAAERGELA